MSYGRPMSITNRLANTAIPQVLAAYVAGFNPNGKGRPLVERLGRFQRYAGLSVEHESEVHKAWRQLEQNAKDKDSLLNLFIVMPDQPDAQPFPMLYGRRIKSPDEEALDYEQLRKSVEAVIKGTTYRKRNRVTLLTPYEQLLNDCSAGTEEAQLAAIKFAEVATDLERGLHALKRLLAVIDPSAKYLTKQPKAQDAALQTYVILVAQLNRYLVKPRHAALATLASINCPAFPITRERVRKAYERNADKWQ